MVSFCGRGLDGGGRRAFDAAMSRAAQALKETTKAQELERSRPSSPPRPSAPPSGPGYLRPRSWR